MKTPVIHLKDFKTIANSVLCYGHFTSVHAGHIRYLKHAKSLGKPLLLALIGDGLQEESHPYPFTQSERAEALSLLGISDYIILLEDKELTSAVKKIKPSFLVLGTELQNSSYLSEAIALVTSQGGSVRFHGGDVTYASAELLTNSESDIRRYRRNQFISACNRHGISYSSLINSMNTWASSRLIVLGDTIVDEYAACEALGMSAEAPVVVVRELANRNFIGAAAVVAAHIRALGAEVDLVSVVGDDSSACFVHDKLKSLDIGNKLVTDSSRPTTLKKRYLVENQKLFRVSKLEQHNVDPSIEDKIIENLKSLAPFADGIVVSDFVYGVVTPRILSFVKQLSNKYGLKLFGDLQCSSQLGSITRFNNFSLLCPNERELRLALQDKDSGLESLSQRLFSEAQCEKLLLKLASDGFIAYYREENGRVLNQPFPALSPNPLDVTGAGDSVLAVMATGLSSNQDMMSTAALACCMASLSVDSMGNQPIEHSHLRSALISIGLN